MTIKKGTKYKNKSKILLILDLDETLIHSSPSRLRQKVDFMASNYFVYKRPYLDLFLEAIKNDFLLAVWSSGSDDYVNEIIQKIIPEDINLEFVWGRSRCSCKYNPPVGDSRDYDTDSLAPYTFIKPLQKVNRKGYCLEKTLIVDDNPNNSVRNFGNVIYPKKFTGDKNDDELLYLIKYLKELKDEKNVLRIEKRNWRSNTLPLLKDSHKNINPIKR